MTLEVYDEKGQMVSHDNYLLNELNGTEGDVVDRELTLENRALTHYHRGVIVEALDIVDEREGIKVKVYVARLSGDLDKELKRLEIDRMNTATKVTLFVRMAVKPGTEEKSLTGKVLDIVSTRYPL